MFRASNRIRNLTSYAFATLERKVASLRLEGHDPIDFGVGDPMVSTPPFIRHVTAEGLEKHKAGGYPSYTGEEFFRKGISYWMEKRFDLQMDPEKEINITLGSKEAIFHVHEAFVNPGDVVISPSPGYPPYARGAKFAEGINYFYPLTQENDYLPDLKTIPLEVAKKAKIFWICQPHVPTGRMMDGQCLNRVVDFCKRYDILLCSDEAYIDLYYDVPPPSLIKHARKGVLVFFSLSKRSAMTGYRCGWVAGDARAISIFKDLKTNIDSGVPKFVQEGALAAMGDEKHVKDFREGYLNARDRMVEALIQAGLPRCMPQAGLYIWQRAPQGLSGLRLAERLLEPDLALVTMPGEWLAEPIEETGENPGYHYVRFAFIPPLARIEEAARRLSRKPIFKL